MGIAARGELRLKGLVGLAVVQAGDALLACFETHQHLRQVAIGGRPGDQRNIGRAVENLFALLLRHAAQHGKALALLVQRLVIVQAVEDLLLRLVANRAGVVENQRGLGLLFHLR